MKEIYLRPNWLEYYQLDKALGYFAENTNSCFLPYHNITHASEVLYHALCIAYPLAKQNLFSELDIRCLGIAAIFHNANYNQKNPGCSIDCCEKYFDFTKDRGMQTTLNILSNYFRGLDTSLSRCLYDANYIYLVNSQFLYQQVLGRFEEEKRTDLDNVCLFIDEIISQYEEKIYFSEYADNMWKQHKDSFKDRLLKLKKSLK